MLVRQALKTAIASAILAGVFQHSDLTHIQYPVMGLVATMLSSNLGDVVKAGWGRLGGSAVAGFVSALVIGAWGINPVSSGIAFVLSTFFCEVYQLKTLTSQAGTIAALIAIDPGLGKEAWKYVFDRVVDNGIGVIIAVAVTILFWPEKSRQILKNNLVKVLQICHHVFQVILESTLRGESPDVNTSVLIAEMNKTVRQSESLLEKSMYGVVGERLTQENWSDLLANQRRLIRYLSAMAHSVKENRQNRALSIFTEDLTQFVHQVSTACTAICSIIQSSKTVEKVADEIPVLEVHLQAIINRLNQIRIKKKLKGHILEDIIQFYNLLEIITNFTQELDGLIVKLRTREKSTPLLASRWSFKSLPLPVKQIKHIIKTGVAVGLTAAITNFTHQPFGYYATIAVVITMQPTLGKSIDAGKQRAIGTGIGAIIAFIIVNTIGSSPLAVGLGVGLTILTCSYYGFSQGYKPGCFLVAISIMVYGTEPNYYIWKRFTETLLGIVVAQLVSRLFWPETASHNLDPSISQTLIRIGKLYELTVNQYLQGLNSKAEIERLAKEIRQSIQTHSLLQAESKLEPVNNLTASKTQRKWNFLISYEQTLFDNILSLHDAAGRGNPRGFVHNFVDELQSLEEGIIQAFNELAAALERESQREFPLVLQPLDMIVQKIEQLRVTGTSLEYPLNDIIIFLGVLSSMKEVAENLNQMATDWPVVL